MDRLFGIFFVRVLVLMLARTPAASPLFGTRRADFQAPVYRASEGSGHEARASFGRIHMKKKVVKKTPVTRVSVEDALAAALEANPIPRLGSDAGVSLPRRKEVAV